MNVTVNETIEMVIAYLVPKAVGVDADLTNAAGVTFIFTGPNEERDNNSKKFITLMFEYVPLEAEMGDNPQFHNGISNRRPECCWNGERDRR